MVKKEKMKTKEEIKLDATNYALQLVPDPRSNDAPYITTGDLYDYIKEAYAQGAQSQSMGYSEEQVKELLKKQREICANKTAYPYLDEFGCFCNVPHICLNAPEPPFPASQSISDIEINNLANNYVLINYKKLNGFTGPHQVYIRDIFIDGYKAALSITSKEKAFTLESTNKANMREEKEYKICPHCGNDNCITTECLDN